MQNDTPLKYANPALPWRNLGGDQHAGCRLVALLAVRQAYIERAAQLKTGRDQVRDERIEDVVAKVIAEGRRAGLTRNARSRCGGH